MTITNSTFLVIFISLVGILYPIARNIIKRRKSKAGDITYYIIHTMIFYPIPGFLLGSRQMTPIGAQSIENMTEQFESGLSSQIIAINYIILLYLVILNLWLLIKRGNIFNRYLVSRDKWFYLIVILNIGLLSLSVSLSDLIYLFLLVNFLLFGKFDASKINPMINTILILFFYSSLILIFIKPEVTIFEKGEWSGIFTNPNGIVIVANFAIILILLLPYFNLKRTKWHYLNIAFLIFMIVMSDSRNGLLTFFLIISYFLISVYRLRFFKSVIVFLAIPLLYYAIFSLKRIDLISLTSDRLLIWEYATHELSKNFILGLGPDFFSLENRSKSFPSHLFFATSSYSSFVDYIVFYGILGVSALIGFMVSFYKKAKKIHPLFLMFFILFIIPNLVESYFRPPVLNLNNVVFLIILFIMNGCKDYFFQDRKSVVINDSSNKTNFSTLS